MTFQNADTKDFFDIRQFYWDISDDIQKNNHENKNLGWEKGVYPSDKFIKNSLAAGELYTLTENGVLCACVILNSEYNDGYNGCAWSMDCTPDEILVPHALAVNPKLQGKGIGKTVVKNILNIAKAENKKTVRLDVLSSCKAAERLYLGCGFRFVEAKEIYYEDTGLTEYKMFELIL